MLVKRKLRGFHLTGLLRPLRESMLKGRILGEELVLAEKALAGCLS